MKNKPTQNNSLPPQDQLLYEATKNKAHQQKMPIFLWWLVSAKPYYLLSILSEERKYISGT